MTETTLDPIAAWASRKPYTDAELSDPDFVPAFFGRRTSRKAREIVLRRLLATIKHLREAES